MIDDVRVIPEGSQVCAEVCIVGAGPAGIVLALVAMRLAARPDQLVWAN